MPKVIAHGEAVSDSMEFLSFARRMTNCSAESGIGGDGVVWNGGYIGSMPAVQDTEITSHGCSDFPWLEAKTLNDL